MNTQNEKVTVQDEQQPVTNEIIYNELQKLNKNLENISDAIWSLKQYGINVRI